MKWIPITWDRLHEVERQVQEVCNTLEMLSSQASRQRSTTARSSHAGNSNLAQVQKALEVLSQSASQRVKEFETFYLENDLHVNASRIEACRLRLKRLLNSLAPQSAALPQRSLAATNGVHPMNLSQVSSVAGPPDASGIISAPSLYSYNAPTSPTPVAASGGDVLVRIVMSAAEFEQLKLRRATMQQFLLGTPASRTVPGVSRPTATNDYNGSFLR